MLNLLGVRGFAFFILVLALLNMVIFMIPGLSLVFGLPLVILTVQMVLGFRAPLFPAFIRRRSISAEAVSKGLKIGMRGMRRVEHLVKPRFAFLSGPYMYRLHSLLALVMAVQMALPIPILNLSPSLGLVVLALGMMQRDGIFIAGAYVIGMWSLWLFGSIGRMAHFLVQ